MLTKSLFALSALLGFTEAQESGAYVHDLDDDSHVQRIKFTGLNLNQYNRESFLSVTSDSGSSSQGYTWLIDYDDCDGVVDITSSIVDYPSTNPNVDNGYSEEIFTLTADGFGTCDFTIAYAIPWQFSSFTKYEKAGGRVISIPIRVVDGDANPSTNEGSSESSTSSGSSPNGSSDDSWISPEQSEQEDWSVEKKSFDVFGWNEWARAFFFAHIISDLPTAWSFLRLRNGNLYGADTFKWLARWYTEIAGWAASVANFTLAGVLLAKGIDEYQKTGVDTFQYTDCQRNNVYTWQVNCEEKTGIVLNVWTAWFVFIIGGEIATWILYYINRHGAYRYADMLDKQKDQYY